VSTLFFQDQFYILMNIQLLYNGSREAIYSERMQSDIEKMCEDAGLKMTVQRKVIAKVISESDDHPDVEELHERVHLIDPTISLATVYRTINIFEITGLIKKLEIGDGKARYETSGPNTHHHHHLVDLESGKILEFHDPELEQLKEKIAHRMGYRLTDHRLELYGVPLKKDK
jgi:Fur family transcriptional regulator, ferric uptake regulator